MGAERLSEFRPVSCCSTVYKIIYRLLSTKLKLFLADAVQSNQVGFIKDRLLCENVLLASELMADFQKPSATKRGCLQVDLTKAYDSIDWRFFLTAFDLPLVFISWIKECITTTTFSINFNGKLVGFFQGRKGLRQGDPISSSLFDLAMEILSKKLDQSTLLNRFIPHPLCLNLLVTHLSFADDVLLFFDGTTSFLEGIMDVLRKFYDGSRLAINLRKSYLFLDGNNTHLTSTLARRFVLAARTLPVRYLGLPLLPHKMKTTDYQLLIDKVKHRISYSLVKHLSFPGRLQLIKSVLAEVL